MNKSFFLSLLVSFLFFSSAYSQTPSMGMPHMSPDELAAFEKEMAEFQKEFEALSPQEQEEFVKSMQEAAQKIEEMSKTEEGKALLEKLERGDITDEELDLLVNQLVGEQEQDDAVQEIQEEVVIQREEPKIVLSSKEEQIRDLLTRLLNYINSFSVKAASITEMNNKIHQWAKRKSIATGDKTWTVIKKDIDTFVFNVSKLLEQDPITKAYYHLDALLNNEALLNNIKKVYQELSEQEPLIEEQSLVETKKMSAKSKKAMQKTINQFNEALYILNLNDELQKLFVLFDPQAEKMKKAQEDASKAAQKKQPIRYQEAIVVGTEDEDSSYSPSSYDSYTPRSYAPSYREPYSYDSHPYFPSDRFAANEKKPESASGAPSTKTTSPGKIADDKKEKDITKKDTDAPSKGSKHSRSVHDDEIVKLQKDIDGKFAEIGKMILENDFETKVKGHFINTDPIDISLAVETIPTLQRKLSLKDGIIGDITNLHRKAVSSQAKESQQKRLYSTYEKYSKILGNFVDALDSLEKKWPQQEATVPFEKKYAFFAIDTDISANPNDPKYSELINVKSKVIAPQSLFGIKKNIEEVKNYIKNFNKKDLGH